jgi:hypothetical protein
MTGSFAAAYYALQQPQVGGLSGVMDQIDPQTLRLLPDPSDWGTAAGTEASPGTPCRAR